MTHTSARYFFNKEAARVAREGPPKTPYTRSKLWWSGMLLTIVGAIGDEIALSIGDPALVTAVGGTTCLLANVLIGKFWNKEYVTRDDLIGVVMVVGGAVCIAVGTAKGAQPEITDFKDLVEKFENTHFVVFAIVDAIFIVIILSVVGGSFANSWAARLTRKFVRPMLVQYELVAVEMTTKVEELEGRLAQLEDARGGTVPTALRHRESNEIRRAAARRLHDMRAKAEEVERAEREKVKHKDPYFYAACAGIIGAVSVLLGSAVGRIFILTFTGKTKAERTEPWESPYSYMLIVFMGVTIASQTAFLNAGMERGDVMAVYPLFQAFWIGFGTLGSAFLYWQPGHHYATLKKVLYGVAFVLMVTGAYLLYKHRARQAKARDDDKDGNGDGEGGNDDELEEGEHIVLVGIDDDNNSSSPARRVKKAGYGTVTE